MFPKTAKKLAEWVEETFDWPDSPTAKEVADAIRQFHGGAGLQPRIIINPPFGNKRDKWISDIWTDMLGFNAFTVDRWLRIVTGLLRSANLEVSIVWWGS